jgi:hypothetical protein
VFESSGNVLSEPPGGDGRSASRGAFRPAVGRRANAHGATAAERAGVRQVGCGRIYRIGKSKRGLSVCGQMRRQKEGLAVPSDAESSTYDVILLNSRRGARRNPLANWKHAIFYWVVGYPEAIGASFRGISIDKSGSRRRSSLISSNPVSGCRQSTKNRRFY